MVFSFVFFYFFPTFAYKQWQNISKGKETMDTRQKFPTFMMSLVPDLPVFEVSEVWAELRKLFVNVVTALSSAIHQVSPQFPC